MEDTPKKSKISLSKPEDLPQEQHEYVYDGIDPTPNYDTSQSNGYQYDQPQQTMYQQPYNARRLNSNIPNTYQQSNSPVPNNSPFQNSNYSRMASPSTKYCKFCGEIIPFDAVVCTKCGRQVEQLQGGNNYQQNNVYINQTNNINQPLSDKNRSTAGILCALFGWLGLHRFYTGHIASGIVYLLTGGLSGIGVIVDLVQILRGKFLDKQGRQLRD